MRGQQSFPGCGARILIFAGLLVSLGMAILCILAVAVPLGQSLLYGTPTPGSPSTYIVLVVLGCAGVFGTFRITRIIKGYAAPRRTAWGTFEQIPLNVAPELRQFGTLGQADFERAPIWVGVHALDYDQPWYDQTNEETFRPWYGGTPIDSGLGMFLVRAEVRLSDGTTFPGFITPRPGSGKVPAHELGMVQPHLILPDHRTINFWGGMKGFTEVSKDAVYAALMKAPQDVFPVNFAAEAGLCNGRQSGQIPGFARLVDNRRREVEFSQ